MKIISAKEQVEKRKKEVWELRSKAIVMKDFYAEIRRKNETGWFRSKSKFFEAKWNEDNLKQIDDMLTDYYYWLDRLNIEPTVQASVATDDASSTNAGKQTPL